MKNIEVVVHLTGTFGCGGLEKVICNLAQETQGTHIRHVVIAIENDMEMESQLPDDAFTMSLYKNPGKDLWSHWRLIKILYNIKPSVLHTYNFPALEYHWIARLLNIRTRIHADHGYGGDLSEGTSIIKNIFRKISTLLIDKYVVVSHDLEKWTIDTVRLPAKKVDVIYNGVVVPEFITPSPVIKGAPFNFISIGRLCDVKNQEAMIDAIRALQKSHPEMPCKLDILGEGDMRQLLEEKISKLPDPSAVTLHGTQLDIAPYLAKADGFLLSSLYEAMPMTVLEAMAASKPVICPSVGGVPQFINEGEAILIPGNNTYELIQGMRKLMSMNYDERLELTKSGYNAVKERFSVEKMSKEYCALYKV